MITVSVFEARRNLGLLIEKARKGEEVLILKDSQPVAAIRPVDVGDLELATQITDRQARRLIEMTESAPARTFRSAAAVRFLKKDMAAKR